jgi:hypothetical protein
MTTFKGKVIRHQAISAKGSSLQLHMCAGR